MRSPVQLDASDPIVSFRAGLLLGIIAWPRLRPRRGLPVPERAIETLSRALDHQLWQQGVYVGIAELAAAFPRRRTTCPRSSRCSRRRRSL